MAQPKSCLRKKKKNQTHKHQTPAEVPNSIEGKNTEAENVQEKIQFQMRCSKSSKHGSEKGRGMLVHRGEAETQRQCYERRMQALRSAAQKRKLQKQQGSEKH